MMARTVSQVTCGTGSPAGVGSPARTGRRRRHPRARIAALGASGSLAAHAVSRVTKHATRFMAAVLPRRRRHCHLRAVRVPDVATGAEQHANCTQLHALERNFRAEHRQWTDSPASLFTYERVTWSRAARAIGGVMQAASVERLDPKRGLVAGDGGCVRPRPSKPVTRRPSPLLARMHQVLPNLGDPISGPRAGERVVTHNLLHQKHRGGAIYDALIRSAAVPARPAIRIRRPSSICASRRACRGSLAATARSRRASAPARVHHLTAADNAGQSTRAPATTSQWSWRPTRLRATGGG